MLCMILFMRFVNNLSHESCTKTGKRYTPKATIRNDFVVLSLSVLSVLSLSLYSLLLGPVSDVVYVNYILTNYGTI